MSALERFYRWLNVISVDVAAGAMLSAAYFVHLAGFSILAAGAACLGLTVWVIYTADHLLDALRLKSRASTVRHRYHQLHFWELVIAALLALAGIGVLLFFVRPEIFQTGIFLFAFVLVYMIVNRYLNYLKELMVACLYCGGVLLPALTRVEVPLTFLVRPECFVFLITALLNLLLFSWLEMSQDKEDGHPSFANHFGERFTRQVIHALFLIQAVLVTYLLVNTPSLENLILLIMNAVLLCLLLFPRFFSERERYRLAGDAVFLLPGLALLL